MATKTDILVIGGGPAGAVSASTARKYYPDRKVLLMKNIPEGVIPCGIPYMFHSLKNADENRMNLDPLAKSGITVVVDEAVSLDRAGKTVKGKSGETYTYGKLILALGSMPVVPPIPGIEKEGIYQVHKDMVYLKGVLGKIRDAKNVLVLGGGFIGVEFADELSKREGLRVYLAEVLPHLLANSFDEEFAAPAAEKLRSRGVTIMTKSRVTAFTGKGRVEGARLEDGTEIAVDSVILGIGASPNTRLATDAGLDLGRGKGIWVDEYMRTADPDIFAVGDCAGKRDFFTRRDTAVMLASTATAEARVAGANLYGLKVIRENKGTIAIYSTYIDGLVLGSAGLTESSAKREGFEIVTGYTEGVDKHPGTLPGAAKIKVKLIFSRGSGVLMGGQVAGGISTGEIINLIGVAIQQRVLISELETLQTATQPFLTAAPTTYPVVLAAQNASSKG